MTENSYCPTAARDGHGKHPKCRYCRFSKLALCAILALFTAGCGQYAGSVYRAEVGRQVTSWFDEEAATTWKAGIEVRFDARR